MNIIYSYYNKIMYSNNIALPTYGTELPFRQSVSKDPSERTAQVSLSI